MDFLLPKLDKEEPKQQSSNNNISDFFEFGSSKPPNLPAIKMTTTTDKNKNDDHDDDIVVLDSDDDDDDDGPPILDCAVPMPTKSPRRPSIPVINFPVSKEQYSIIESHKSKEPKTLLEALQKFNEDKKKGDLATLHMPNLSSVFSGSLSTTPMKPFNNASSSAAGLSAASLTKLVPSLLKKPVTPLAAPSTNKKSSIPVITFKKSLIGLKPEYIPKRRTTSKSLIFPKPLAAPNLPKVFPLSQVTIPPPKPQSSGSSSSSTSTLKNPSVSIQIKETSNAFLDSLLAGTNKPTKSVNDNFETMEIDGPPKLTNYSCEIIAPNDSLRAAFEEFKKSLSNQESDLPPPNLDKFNSGEGSDESESDEEEPPQLEAVSKIEKMAATKNIPERETVSNQKRGRGRPPQKRQSSKNKNGFQSSNENDIDAPPALDLYGEKHSQSRASSTTSGVSSIDEFRHHSSPPSCSPLAPINGEFNSNNSNRRSSKRLSKTPVAETTPIKKEVMVVPITRKRKATATNNSSSETMTSPVKKRSRRAPKKDENDGGGGEESCFIEMQNWIPIGEPWVEMINKKAVCCFPAVKHKTENITFNTLDAICVAAGGVEPDNIGKIDRIFLDKKRGIMANVYWYYRYDQCVLRAEAKQKVESRYNFDERELIASKHMDTISCDSIQSHAFVLTFSEYCRYVAENAFDSLPNSLQFRFKEMWPRGDDNYPRRRFLPHEDTPSELVYFCRKYYSINRKAIFSSAPLPTGQKKKNPKRNNSNNRRPPINGLVPVYYDSNDDDFENNNNNNNNRNQRTP